MKLARNSYFRIHGLVWPTPQVGMVFQDGMGERYMVVQVDKHDRLIYTVPVGTRTADQPGTIAFDAWSYNFRPERRFPWLVVP